MSTLPSEREMYRALLDRDAAYDGIFFVGVRTTGIFCRPVCRARKPRASNVEYFTSAEAAREAGYRACLKCRPRDGAPARPAWVEALLAAMERTPGLRFGEPELRRLGIEPARARRYFKEHFGMTFHAYHRAHRLGLAHHEIRSGGDATGVAFDHGFESLSGFRDAFKRTFGRAPAGARDTEALTAAWLETPLGGMIAAAGSAGLALLEFTDRRELPRELRELSERLGTTVVPGESDTLDRTQRELALYFEGSLTRFSLPLDLAGTAFQHRVWARLQEIPYGETLSYDAMARSIGRPGAQRAVGRANGTNRVAVVVPCHRVVRADGSLCGYGGGAWRKRWLLEHEMRVRRAGA